MKTMHILPFALILFTACSNLQQTAQVRDGVYDKPSREPVASAAPVNDEPRSADDYYDPNTATQYERDYYDMAYNDPYYYNYGRFGFSMGVGYYAGSPCGGSYMGMGSTWGSPYGGYGDPYGGYGYGYPYGGYGYGYPYGGYGSPCGGYYGWNDPWNNYYGSGYYNGYGYYGYGGNCYGCYQPIVYCGGPPVVIGHRPTMGGSTGTGGGDETGNTMNPPSYSSRSLVSLRPVAWSTMRPDLPGWEGSDPGSLYEPARSTQPTPGRTSKPGREQDNGRNGWDMGGGGNDRGSQPSRGTFGGDGGGSRPSTGGGRPR